MSGPPPKPPHQWDLMDMLDARNEGEGEAWTELQELIRGQSEWEPEDYSLVPDRVVSLKKGKYTRANALRRFADIAERQHLIPVKIGETARDYYFECLYEKGHEGDE